MSQWSLNSFISDLHYSYFSAMSQNSSGSGDEVQKNFTSDGKTDCQICGQLAHGHHFCILSCRPCAAFFKRCVTLDRKYMCLQGNNNCPVRKVPKLQRCKACRLQACKNAGMTYYQKSSDISSDDESKKDPQQQPQAEEEEEHIFTSSPACPNFDKLAKVYTDFSTAQQALFTNLHSSSNIPLGHIGDLTVVPFENAKYSQQFAERTKSMLLAMFKHLFNVFYHHNYQLNAFELETTIDACFGHLNFLSSCYLTLKHLPARNDNRFFTAYGHLVIMDDRLDNVLWQLASNMSNPSEYFNTQKKLMHKKFMFIQNLKNIKIAIQHEDFAALIALMFCTKASSSLNTSFGDLWDEYKDKIMAEWFQHLRMRFRSSKEATIQMALLISLLTPLDMIFAKPEEKALSSVGLDNPQQTTNILLDKITMDLNELTMVSRVASAHHQIWKNMHNLPFLDLNKFDRLETLLAVGENVLGLHELLPPSRPQFNEAGQVYSEMRQLPHVSDHPRMKKAVLFFRLLAIGCLKAMPVFRQLTSQDQVILVRNLHHPIKFFTNSFYSVIEGFTTCTGPDGVAPMALYKQEWAGDECIISLADKTFNRPTDRFRKLPLLDDEEFGLLLAILCSHSAISGLSHDAREILYVEQTRLSSLLMRHVQRKLGFNEGAKRYAECIHLIDTAFSSAHTMELIATYLETIRCTKLLDPADFPKCIWPLFAWK